MKIQSYSVYRQRDVPDRIFCAIGVTLVEMVVVIAITGIIAAVVVVFMRRPLEGYMDVTRRAELTDVADTALRRITRDLRTALPNSIRVTTTGSGANTVYYLEYLQTRGGGRYRADLDSGGLGNILDFTTADTAFDVIGAVPTLTGVESIVVYNLTADSAITTANAYYGDNRGTSASSAGSTISFTAPTPGGVSSPFPFASPGKRFQVVQYPVTYRCDLNTGQLTRYWNYTIALAQPTPPATINNALLATNVTGCSFTYLTSGTGGRTGVVSLTLQIERNNEKVRLFQQVHVNNVP